MGMALSVPRYTVDDLDRFPDDGNRYELLDGMLLVTPAPRAVHQIVSTRLSATLYTALGESGYAHIVGPGAITRPPGTQLQPDVLVYPARFAPTLDWGKISEHWLAVEVLSRSSRIYDRNFKRDAYFALGVREVWLVDIRDRSIERSYSPSDHELERDTIHWRPSVAGVDVRIPLDRLLAGIG